MTLEQVFIALLGAALAALGWFARVLYDAVQRLKDDLRLLEVKVSTDYVRYDRLQDALRPIVQMLDEIRVKLDHKADK